MYLKLQWSVMKNERWGREEQSHHKTVKVQH